MEAVTSTPTATTTATTAAVVVVAMTGGTPTNKLIPKYHSHYGYHYYSYHNNYSINKLNLYKGDTVHFINTQTLKQKK